MSDRRVLLPFLTLALFPLQARAYDLYEPYSPGSLVGVSIEIEGRPAPLYPAPDGSGRHYVEAREGARYAVRLDNRTGERVGVVLRVDGLNAISGQQEAASPWAPPGRMYVLDPWDSTTVRGWRTSLSEVRRFTFVDERASYAARSGKANAKMGWIEVTTYRERHRYVRQPRQLPEPWVRDRTDEAGARTKDEPAPPAAAGSETEGRPSTPPGAEGRPSTPPGAEGRRALGRSQAADSYPGTGWGNATADPAEVVSFDPERRPSDVVTLRYEYASALRALGILPWPRWGRDRLSERDRGLPGFAPPPAW